LSLSCINFPNFFIHIFMHNDKISRECNESAALTCSVIPSYLRQMEQFLDSRCSSLPTFPS
jgi:hypothetical protein